MNSNCSCSLATSNLGQNWQLFVPCDLEIWWMTLNNNRAPLRYYVKLYASFQSHRWIKSGVTVRKRPIWVKIDDFFQPCDLEIWRMTLNNYMSIQSEVTVWKWLSWVLTFVNLTCRLWLLTLTYYMDITSVNVDNCWKFQDDTMTGTLSKRCDGWVDVRTYESFFLRAAWSQLNSYRNVVIAFKLLFILEIEKIQCLCITLT